MSKEQKTKIIIVSIILTVCLILLGSYILNQFIAYKEQTRTKNQIQQEQINEVNK